MRTVAVVVIALAVSASQGGCASSADASGVGGAADTTTGADTGGVGFDINVGDDASTGGTADTAGSDDDDARDAGPVDTAGGGDDDAAGHDAATVADAGSEDADGPAEDTSDDDAGGGGLSSKIDPTFLVPPTVSRKSHLALSESAAAWVEEAGSGGSQLVFWAIDRGQDPIALDIPNLFEPSQLQLSETWLVYVDTRYGDDDLFAWHLEDGSEQIVAVLQGAQHQPTLDGTTLAWRDCRECVPGDPDAAAEIYAVELTAESDDADEEQRVTDDEDDDRLPSLGGVGADGALAWVAGADTLRVQSTDLALDEAWTVDGTVLGMTLADGKLAYRQSPLVINPDSMMVINPDSMMPSEVFSVDALSGDETVLTEHSETELALLEEGAQLAGTASSGRVAFLESVAGQLPLQRLQVLDATSGASVDVVDVDEAHEPSLSTTWMGFLAPRADNDGEDDVHLLAL